MGIAACQARFLAITARKANCESDAMQIAQQKLSITRDQMKASNDYQAALNATKLAWATDGAGLYYNQAGLGGDTYDLTYNLMMTPSVLNDYTPYMLTNRSGQIVLDPTMAAAAKAAGLKPNGGSDLSIENRNAFIEGLQGTYLSPSLVTSIESAGNDGYDYNVGLGGPQLDKTRAGAMNINYLMTYSDSLIAGKVQNDNVDYTKLQFNFGKNIGGTDTGLNFSNSAGKNQNYLSKDGNLTTDTGFSLADLLDKDIVFTTTGNTDNSAAALASFVYNLYTAFSQMLGVDDTSKKALSDALGLTNMLLSQNADNSKTVNSIGSAVTDGISGANTSNGWYNTNVMDGKDPWWVAALKIVGGLVLGGPAGLSVGLMSVNWADSPDGGSSSISLSNLARSFLTYFSQSMGGFQTGYSIDKKSKDSVYATDDMNYMYTVNNPDSVCDQTALMTADFYNMLFNNICVHGWTESTNVDDKNYLSNALKNGQLFVSALNTDGYFYQADYTKNGRVIEVKDDDAISRAELKYNQEKNKLDYKDQMLDVKMKNLDLEISALTTEYDSVKNLISKNVEKTFALFQ